MSTRNGLLLCILAIAAHGGEGGLPKTDAVSAAIAELDRLPVAVQYQELVTTMNGLEKENIRKIAELDRKRDELAETPAYAEYARQRRELEAKRESAWAIERKELTERAKQIYAARHDELRRQAPADLPQARALGFDVLTYPRIDGSTSTGPLGVVLACRILGVPYAWLYPEPKGNPWRERIDVTNHFMVGFMHHDPQDYEFLLATLKVVAKAATKEHERAAPIINSLLAAHSSTHDAYVNLIEGRKDLNLTARPPSASELKLAAEKGVTIKMEAIARDAFVCIVHRKNPMQSLTRQQVRDIYEERITEWKAVGGGQGTILAFRRQRDSGSRELFDELVMQGKALPEDNRYRELYADGMGGPYSQVTQRPEGLGYSIYYYEHFMAASPHTRPLAIDGIEPTAETIASGAYPWMTRVYVTWRDGEPADSPAMKLVRWLLSPEGQAVVRESGYVPER